MADLWGIDDGFFDVGGQWQPLGPTSRAALRTAMDCDLERPPDGPPLWFVDEADPHPLDRPCRLVLEDGTDLGTVATLPPDLPLGWHRLTPTDDGPSTTLAIRPRRGVLRDGLRAWMWTVQLYAARSARSWGIGDLGDLATLGAFGAETGASFIGVNPLFDARTTPRCETSPYFPSSRRWLHPMWLRIDEVPGAGGLGAELESLAAAGHEHNHSPRIDRDAIWALKLEALRHIWRNHGRLTSDADFAEWRRMQGRSLEEHAQYRALADRHGPDWRAWPARLRSPGSAAGTPDVVALANDIDFWAWVQWTLERQVAAADRALPLMNDLPIGVDPSGADAWRWQHVLAHGVRIGAPPDPLGPNGQDWGAAPFIPWKLRAAAYAPVVEMVRGACAHAGALRIDHVMGLFRLFWVPPDATPADGGYVRMPATDLLDTVLIEAVRSDTVLVGEDLGTVEGGVRELLAERRVLGTRLVWFEDEPPAQFPNSCLASISTHDLPTVAGLWSGEDTAQARAAGIPVPDDEVVAITDRLARAAGVDAGEHAVDAATITIGAVHALADSPACLVAVSFDDAVGARERPNLPSTTDDVRPNWSIPLPAPIDELADVPLLRRCIAALRAGRPRQPK